MNDFTKEELNFLSDACRYVYKQHIDLGGHVQPYGLMKKINSMIDNYCEHENQGIISDAYGIYFCKDCNVLIWCEHEYISRPSSILYGMKGTCTSITQCCKCGAFPEAPFE